MTSASELALLTAWARRWMLLDVTFHLHRHDGFRRSATSRLTAIALVSTVLVAGALVPSLASARRAAPEPSRCPASGQQPTNGWSPTRSHLLPPHAARLRLCRYAPGGRELVRSRLVTQASTVDRIASRLAALPRLSGVTACPADNGAKVIGLATYASGHRAAFSVGLSGCDTATNGHLARTAMGSSGPGAALLRELERLTR